MNPSFVTAPRLTRVRLLHAECELINPTIEGGQAKFTMQHEASLKPFSDDGPGFFITTETTVIGFDKERAPESEAIKINCKFAASYALLDESLEVNDFKPLTDVYANQIYPYIRQFLVDTLNQMDISAGSIPYSLIPESKQDKGEAPKEAPGG